MRAARLGSLVALVAVAGCSGASGDNASASDAVDARHDVEMVPTLEGGSLSLLGSYNYVFDQAGNGEPCVTWSGAPRVQVSGLTTTVSVNYVSSLSKLEEQLGIDATLGAKVDPIASGSLTAKYTNSVTTTDNRYSYLLTVQQRYSVTAAAPLKMTADRPTKTDDFQIRCGDSFVKGLTYGASLNVVMSIDAPSREKADQLAAGVTASAQHLVGGAVGSVDAGGNVTHSTTSSTSQFKITYSLEAQGFDPSQAATPLPTTDGQGIGDSLAQLAASYLKVMSASAAADQTADASANGENASRKAVPALVTRGYYTSLPNFSAGPNPFAVINERTARARGYLNSFAYLNAQILDVYYDEVQRFLQADGSNKFRYNVVSPGIPQANAGALNAIAQTQAEVFSPRGGASSIIQNVAGGVYARIHDCIEGSREPTYAACLTNPKSLPEYTKALDALDLYAKTARILPANYYSTGDHVYFRDACSNPDVANYVLADQTQIRLLAPAVAADPQGCAWYTDTTNQACGSLSQPYFTSNSTETAEHLGDGFTCGSDLNVLRSCAILCVPADGVFGVPTPLGRGAVLQ